MIPIAKYALRPPGEAFAAGVSDLAASHGGLVETGGCLVLSVVSGAAVAMVNFTRRRLREGDFVLLLYDSTFSVESLSEGFAVRYASFSYALVEEAIYKPLSDLFWQFVYARPVSHPSSRQQQLLDAWWCQLQWIAGINADVCRDELLRNALRTLLVAVDVELARFAPRMAAGSWGGSS